MARSLNFSSILCYLNIISILHKEFNLPNPLSDSWSLKSLLTGIKRVLGQPPAEKRPITPSHLLNIFSNLNLRTSFDASFWAICLVSFFAMLRKYHLLASYSQSFNPCQTLIRSDIFFFPWVPYWLCAGVRLYSLGKGWCSLPLPLIPESPLCPVTAAQRALPFTNNLSLDSQAFMWQHPISLHYRLFTYSQFLKRFRAILSVLGLPAKEFSCHSFRRGGASFAFQAGVPVELIKMLGDWHSDAVFFTSVRLESANVMVKSILTSSYFFLLFPLQVFNTPLH